MGQTIVEKISQTHMAEGPDRLLRAGDFLSIRPDHVMTHDNTSAVMKKFKAIGARKVHDPAQAVFTADHDIQNTDESNLAKYRSMETFAVQQGIDFYPPGTGIGHQIMVEKGYVLPGDFVVASDSHSNMYGALGAIGTPVVRTDAAAIWATGEFWWQIPRTIQVVLEGRLSPGVTGKDVIITLCGLYNHEEVLNAAVEFTGSGVASLSMDARLSIANMTTEWGALVGWFPVDEVTLSYIGERNRELRAHGFTRISERRVQEIRSTPPKPDPDAVYGGRIVLDLSEVTPHVSGPDTVQVMQSVTEIEKKKVGIHKAYLVSCVNSRLEDLAAAAKVLEGKKVAPNVKFYLAAASRSVQQEAEKRGTWQTLTSAGAQPLPPGCGPCIGLGTGLLEAGEVGISATNRNFKGRMGSRDAQCYLASPEVVAASAVAGYICGPVPATQRDLKKHFELFEATSQSEKVEILPGFPRQLNRPPGLPPARQPEHRRHLRQGLHLPRKYDTGNDGQSRDGELRPDFRRAHTARRRGCRRVQLRNRFQPRASRNGVEVRGHSAGHRGQLLANLPAQCLQQRVSLHRDAGVGEPPPRKICRGDQ